MDQIIAFAAHWLGGFSSVLSSYTGILICVLAVGAFWNRRIRMIDLFLLMVCGGALALSPFIHRFVEQFFPINHGMVAAIGSLSAIIIASLIFFLRRGDFYAGGDFKNSLFTRETYGRKIYGSTIAVPVVIFLATTSVFVTGISAPQVMIGDEVTHYYMLTHQAEDLSIPQFVAKIPTPSGYVDTRRYPHPFGWHYLGAVVHRVTHGSFIAVQLYHTLFFIQFLVVAYLLARDRQGGGSRSSLVYVLVLASLPITLIFSVAFYQDVPMTAQILTAFYLLKRKRWLWATLFVALATFMKVTAVLFFPAFYLLLFIWQVQNKGWIKSCLACFCSLLIVLGVTWWLGRMIAVHGENEFYPQVKLEKFLKNTKRIVESQFPVVSKKTELSKVNTTSSAKPSLSSPSKESKPPIIANHPGDLRVKVNYAVYGGIVLWLVFLGGIAGGVYSRISGTYIDNRRQPTFWLYWVGISYTVIAAWYLRTAPDARFFLPGLPFLLLPFVEKMVRLPVPKIVISIVASLAILQAGYVLQKAYDLRALTPDTKEAIAYLQENPPEGVVFMYPEGNYRYFPQHEWYLGYRLREFWRGDNDYRLELLRKFNIDAIVVKKYLIAQVDPEITNLGVYPYYFVKEIDQDSRFVKIFENNKYIIYRVDD